MKVELEKTFPIPASTETAWQFLENIEAVAGCMPGAKITERLDELHYKGTMTVRVGPATMSFKGDIEVAAVDAAARSLRLIGKGSDTTGSSFASMDLTARIEAVDAANCNLSGRSEVTMGGKAASLGGRMMGSVADQMLKQFAANFARQVQALRDREAAAAPLPESAVGRPAEDPVATAAAEAAAPANELNGLALLWAIVRDWFRHLFSRKPA